MKNHGLIPLLETAGLCLETLHRLAVQTGFIRRCRQIQAVAFLVYLIAESVRGCVSCNDLAAVIETETGIGASRQAYHQKMRDTGLRFLEAILAKLLQSKTLLTVHSQFHRFRRILIQDSTVIQLPSKLLKAFSGVGNAHVQVCNARIQSVFDLLSGCFTQWSIDPYTKNDMVSAPELAVKAGDLVLRDRGYFTTDECERIQQARADFVSRYKHKTTLYDPRTGQELDLVRLLDTQRNLDQWVAIGRDRKTPVRLVAIEVSQETASRRRQKAQREQKGHHPSQAVLFLMGWTIFLTSLPREALTVEQLIEVYGLRWKIEILFKVWKSHLSFDKIHTVGAIQLRVILIARFIALLLLYEKLYIPLQLRVDQACQKTLSLLKLVRYISRNLQGIPRLLNAIHHRGNGLRNIERYCTYDKRKRQNFIDKERTILSAIEPMKTLN